MPAGRTAKLYVSPSEIDTATAVATLQGDVTFVETCVIDVTLDLSATEIDASDRCGNGFTATVAGLKQFSIDTALIKKKSAGVLPAYYTNLRDAFMNDSLVTVMVLDDDKSTTGADGFVAVMSVFNFSEDQPLEDVIKNNITLKSAGDSVYPPVAITMP
jgi:hypothetical protein